MPSATSKYIAVVCGGRDYDDYEVVVRVLEIANVDYIRHGGARGADTLADKAAKARGIGVHVYKADWKTWGKAAGPIRNQQMIGSHPDMVIAFPGGRGTEDARRRAIAAGIPLWTVSERRDNKFDIHIKDEFGDHFHTFEVT